MQEQRELRCVIAAGGTAGHVLPALAVAEALRARGVSVSFAGSPTRSESRARHRTPASSSTRSRSSGAPAAVSAAARSGALVDGGERAPVACRADPAPPPARRRARGGRLRRRADGARRAHRCGIPAALTEADAHLGLANRLAAPFARQGLPRLSARRAATAPSTGSSAGRSRAARVPPRSAATRLAGASGCPRTGPSILVCGGSQGARRAQRGGGRGVSATTARRCCISAGERDYADARRRCASAARATGCCRSPTTSDRRSPPPTSSSRERAGRSGRSRPPASRRSSSPIPHATADHQTKNARYFAARRRRRARSASPSSTCARQVEAAARRPGQRLARDGRGDARARAPGGGRRQSPRS